MESMDKKALALVDEYIEKHLDVTDGEVYYDVFTKDED